MAAQKYLNADQLLVRYLRARGAVVRADVCHGIRLASLVFKPAPSHDLHKDVVLVHGIGSSAGHFGQTALALRSMGFTVHVPDLPGHGLSDEFTGQMTHESLFEALRQWIDCAAPKHFALIGNSLGGALAWWYAGTHPERLSKLILISPAVGFHDEAVWEDFVKGLEIKTYGETLAFLHRIQKKPAWYSPLLVFPTKRNMARAAVRDLLKTRYSELSLQHRISEVMVPTLLIWGKNDRLFPRANLEWVKKRLPPTVEVLEPEGVGHCPQLDSPKWLNSVLRKALLSV
jgi:pimeloyl-ACP methyl ester carboxylesterase